MKALYRIAFTRFFLVAAILTAMALPLSAGSVVLYDNCYDRNGGTACNVAGTRAPNWQEQQGHNDSVTRDVIGDISHFDIDQITFTTLGSNQIQIDAIFRYGGLVTTGSDGTIGVGQYTTYVGDILFSRTTPSQASPASQGYAGAAWAYGIKIGTDTRDLIAGFNETGLYQIKDNKVKLSNEVFSGGNFIYRQYTPVWFDTDHASKIGNEENITVTQDPNGMGLSNEYQVSITISNDGFFGDLYKGMYVTFASATCANDIVYGNVAVPEPGAFLLMGAVAGALAIGMRRRKRKKA